MHATVAAARLIIIEWHEVTVVGGFLETRLKAQELVNKCWANWHNLSTVNRRHSILIDLERHNENCVTSSASGCIKSTWRSNIDRYEIISTFVMVSYGWHILFRHNRLVPTTSCAPLSFIIHRSVGILLAVNVSIKKRSIIVHCCASKFEYGFFFSGWLAGKYHNIWHRRSRSLIAFAFYWIFDQDLRSRWRMVIAKKHQHTALHIDQMRSLRLQISISDDKFVWDGHGDATQSHRFAMHYAMHNQLYKKNNKPDLVASLVKKKITCFHEI